MQTGDKGRAGKRMAYLAHETRRGRVSFQVLQEFYSNILSEVAGSEGFWPIGDGRVC